jgi:hypothetical protein
MARAESFSEVVAGEVERSWDSQPCNVCNSAGEVNTMVYFSV